MVFIIIGAVFLLTAAVIYSDSVKSKRLIEKKLKTSYGKPRENIGERTERIADSAGLFLNDTKNIPDTDKIDDITWDDLGMDDIFLSADHTDSYAGAQYLYSTMHILDTDESKLAEHDRRADYFDKNEDKRLEVQKSLYSLGQTFSGFRLIDDIGNIGSKQMKYRRLFPVLAMLLLALAAASIITRNAVILFIMILMVMVNMVVHTFIKGSMEQPLQTVYNAVVVINTAKKISKEVPQMSGEIMHDIEKMSPVLKKSGYLFTERNMEITRNTAANLLFFILDIFMLDLVCFSGVVDELSGKTAEFMNIYRFTGSIDYDISLGSYRRYVGEYCIPEFTDKPKMSVKGVCHPLIKDAVRNDFEYRRNTVITGSNASGKSTFIKSAALALIMGQTLHTCHAESAVIPRCGVMTSMAVRDDILSGESYYIREIRYLKRMVELCRKDRLMFLAIDEILRGTNTRERIAASKAVMEYFSEQNCMTMVATHDIELSEHFSGRCDNYHFCEQVGESDVIFDYKLHSGISTTSNAIRLLGAMGFPDSIVSNARTYIE